MVIEAEYDIIARDREWVSLLFAEKSKFLNGLNFGKSLAKKGYKPDKPICIIPGILSTQLKVVKSPYPDWEGKRLWINLKLMMVQSLLTENTTFLNFTFFRRSKSKESLSTQTRRKWSCEMYEPRPSFVHTSSLSL